MTYGCYNRREYVPLYGHYGWLNHGVYTPPIANKFKQDCQYTLTAPLQTMLKDRTRIFEPDIELTIVVAPLEKMSMFA